MPTTTDRDIERIQANQEQLRRSIASSKRLVDETDRLLEQHRNNLRDQACRP